LPAGAFVPVIVLTADVTSDAKSRALAAGAHDFLTKPFEQLEVVLHICRPCRLIRTSSITCSSTSSRTPAGDAPGEGTGLGLSLCRASSRGAQRDDRRRQRAGPGHALHDEPEIAAVIAEALERDGHKADVATNGALALTMLGMRSYDLVLSDTRMPVMDGEAFFAELVRRDPTFRRRVIFLTGDVLSREKRAFLERTGAPFLTKPCDLGDVRRLVQRVVAQNAG
jgi:CheY-like chemotaxis protein